MLSLGLKDINGKMVAWSWTLEYSNWL